MNATTAKLILEMIGSMAKPPHYGMLDTSPKPAMSRTDHTIKTEVFTDSKGNKRTRRFYIDGVTGKHRVEISLPTFIATDSMNSSAPRSAAKLGREARKRGVKPHVPEEGGSWPCEQERDRRVAMETIARLQNENAAKARAELMETAKMQLAVYCRKMSIDDAECQRIADRINYEHSEKNHLRNPKPLKSQTDVIASAIRKLGKGRAQRVIDAAAEQILLEGK